MRVLVVTPWWPTREHPNFAPFMVSDVTLVQEGNQVIVVHLVEPSRHSEHSYAPPGIRVICLPFHFSNPRTWLAAARALRGLLAGADLVHTMALASLIPVALARPKGPWVHTEHYSTLVAPTTTVRQKASLWVQRQMYRLPDQLVAVGDSLAEVVSRTSRGRVTVVANQVMTDDECLRNEKDEIGASRSVRAVAVGGLIPRKGPIKAVDAIAELNRRGINACLRWIGDGELADGVRERARAHGLEERIELVGSIDKGQLQEELRKANLFLLPTEAETFGVAIAEALAHGLPVVTSGVGGHLEFLPDAASRVVTDRNGVALADAIEDLISDSSRLTSREIWSYARSRFSDSARHDAYQSIYSAALNAHGSGDTVA